MQAVGETSRCATRMEVATRGTQVRAPNVHVTNGMRWDALYVMAGHVRRYDVMSRDEM